MGNPEKKRLKARAKTAKKQAKAEIKAAVAQQDLAPEDRTATSGRPEPGPSPGVRFAESVRGVLYVVLAVSLVTALILGQRGAIMSLDDIVDSLFAVWTGKIILVLIALALLIYGLKHLRVVR